jgi:hypothetical protein
MNSQVIKRGAMPDKEPGYGVTPEIAEVVRSLFQSLPETHYERHATLSSIRELFQKELAAAYQQTFRSRQLIHPEDSDQSRKVSAIVINSDLKRLGLCFRSRSGKPAFLTVGAVPAEPGATRSLILKTRDRRERPQVITHSSELTLMAMPPEIDIGRGFPHEDEGVRGR